MIESEQVETEQDLLPPQHRDQDLSLWADLSKKSTEDVNTFLVTDKLAFNRTLEILADSNLFAYDTETNGTFERFRVRIVGASFAWKTPEEYYACYLPLSHHEGSQVPIDYALDGLKTLFECDRGARICHNAKFDEMVLARHGITARGVGHDTLVMAWMLAENSASRGLKQQIETRFGVEMETYEDVISNTRKQKGIDRDYNFARVPLDSALSYAAADAYWTYRLYELFEPLLRVEGLWDAYTHVERPFLRVLRDVEAHGVSIDIDKINYAHERLPKIIEEVEGSIYREAGEVFNIGSGAQLGRVLFDKLGIGNNVPRTKSGNYKTDKKTLTTYAAKHEVVENVLRRKKIEKTHSVFVEGLQKFIAEDGRVHPSFNGCGTVTGRLSCRAPNLQQIEGDEVEEVKIRDFFVPSVGNKFIVADYGQIELRLMAHFAKDQGMIDAFNSGRDFHDETARKMFHLTIDDEVTGRQRFHAKGINFGIGYGRMAGSIAEFLGVTEDEALEYILAWEKAFPSVIAYRAHLWKQARINGYIRTLTGRKRRLLPEIRANNKYIRARAQRQAFNTKIQGSAADIIKIAMIALAPKLTAINSFICIQIHDELVIEAPAEVAEEALQTTRETMERPFNNTNPLRLPLVVDPKIVDKWGDGK